MPCWPPHPVGRWARSRSEPARWGVSDCRCSSDELQVWETQHRYEGIVEVGTAGELDVLDARRQLKCDLALAIRQERDLGPFACGVADRYDLVDVDRRHEPDDLGALRVEVRTEGAAEEDLIQVGRAHAEDIHEDLDPGRDRTLCELELANVTLREVYPLGKQESLDSLDLDEASCKRMVPGFGSRQHTARVVEQADVQQLRDRVDQPGAAKPLRGHVAADHLQLDRVAQSHALDGAVGGAHAAFDLAAFERRSGWRRGGKRALAAPDHDLAIGTHVDEHANFVLARDAGREHTGYDVGSDVRAQRGQRLDVALGMNP